jgi:hypothetical protein
LKLTVPKPESRLAFAALAVSTTQLAATLLHQVWAPAVRAEIGFNRAVTASTAGRKHFVVVLMVGSPHSWLPAGAGPYVAGAAGPFKD